MEQLQWWMKILLRYTLKYGSIYFTDDCKSIAMWIGPDKPIIDDAKILSLGLMLYPFKIGVRNFMRVLDISGQWNKEHKNPDWYIGFHYQAAEVLKYPTRKDR